MSADTVLKAYLAYLGRPPDQSGLSFYGNAAPTAAVAAIASSSEAGAMLFSRASDTPREQVDGVYTHLFGRLADPDGASYWVGELQAGRLSSEQLPLAVLNSAQNQDALVISNKLKVIDAFVAQLSNPNFGTAYGGNSAATSLRGLIADVGSDDSSLQAALSLVERAVSLIVANKDVAKTGSPLSTDNPGGLVSLYTLQASSFASNKMTELAGLDAFVADARFSGITGKGQTIAIIDSSFDLDHPAFGPDANGDGVADRIVYHADFTPERNGANTVDTAEDKHGTHVASIAAGQLSEARGIAPGANLILLQGLQEKGGGSNGDLQQALQWVVKNAAFYNIVAVNNSWGGDSNVDVESTTFFGDELSALIQLGVVPTVAAGNSYEEYQALGVGSPADDTFALGVSSSNGSVKVLSEFSQRSEKLSDIVAPGSNVLGASSGGGVISLSGTSMAAPVVAGSVALAQELAQSTLGRRLTVAEVYQVLQSSASRFTDGEIATDSVKNTGANFRHLDIKAMGEAILALGGGGNGSIGGGGGNDSIGGGSGNDSTSGGGGNDSTGGGSGNDSTSGGGGNDSIGGDDDNPYLDRLVGAIGTNAGQTVSGELETAGEPDFFAVNLSAGNIYEIALTGDTLDDPYLRVFNPDGSLLGEDDDGNDGLNSVLNLNIQRTGRYYVSADSSLGSETGTYSLEISAGTAAPAGGVRSFSVASNDKVVAGEIAFGGELNRHTIELNTGRLYTFSLRGADSGVGTLPDPYLELFQNDSLIVFSDDGGVGLDSRINFIPSTSGSYTLVASGYSLTESGSYTLQIGSQVYSGPPEIPGNKSTQASLAVAGSVSGNVDYQGDEDWFRVDLQAGNQYSFSLSGLPDSLLKLFDSSGDFVAFDDDGGGGTDSLLRFAPTSNGTYYIAASVYGNLDTGSYSLGMSSQVATSETVSSVRDAGVLGLGTTVNGVLASEAGYDVYTIALSPARYRITVLPGAGQDPLEDPVIFVDEDRFFLDGLFDDDGGTELDSLLEFSPTKAVNAIIAVGGYDAGAYTLLIQPL